MNDDKLRATAVHEAGHAVAARELGIGIRRLRIVEDEDSTGRTLYYGRPISDEQYYSPDARTQRQLEKRIIATWAGPLAEERAPSEWNATGAGLSEPFEHPEHGTVHHLYPDGDLGRIQYMAGIIHAGPGRSTDAYVEYLRCRALDLLEHGRFIWAQVEAVAAALIKQKTLSGKQTRDVCWRVIEDALARGRTRCSGGHLPRRPS
jgi:hypothetical protein